jgi:hypothetical protein
MNILYSISDFSLTEWLVDRDLSVNSVITDTVSNDLIKVLGLDEYMGFSDSCSMTFPRYNNATDGWFNGRYSLVHLYYMSLSDSCSMTFPGYNSATDGWFNGR